MALFTGAGIASGAAVGAVLGLGAGLALDAAAKPSPQEIIAAVSEHDASQQRVAELSVLDDALRREIGQLCMTAIDESAVLPAEDRLAQIIDTTGDACGQTASEVQSSITIVQDSRQQLAGAVDAQAQAERKLSDLQNPQSDILGSVVIGAGIGAAAGAFVCGSIEYAVSQH